MNIQNFLKKRRESRIKKRVIRAMDEMENQLERVMDDVSGFCEADARDGRSMLGYAHMQVDIRQYRESLKEYLDYFFREGRARKRY